MSSDTNALNQRELAARCESLYSSIHMGQMVERIVCGERVRYTPGVVMGFEFLLADHAPSRTA